jgi:RNA polymerase sigma factor (sigma-70 family)
MGLNYGDLFEDWEIALAKGIVSQFQAEHPWLKTWEFEDLLQECLSHWHSRRSRFRPERGASAQTYMRTVVNNKLRSLLRRELSDKRRIQHLTLSLDAPLDEEGTTLGDIVPSDVADIGARLDVASLVSGLTPLQKQICRLLAEDVSPSQVARMLGKPRHTVRREIDIIRQAFLKQGFGGNRR